MRTSNVFFVGTSAEVEHHIRPVSEELNVQIVGADEIVGASKAGDVTMFFSEHFDRFRQSITELKQKNVATIYICLLYTSPSPRDKRQSRMPSSA